MRSIVNVIVAVAMLFVWAGARVAAQTSVPSASPSMSPELATALAVARDRLETMLKSGHADASWFSASFLAEVPIDKVNDILANMASVMGTFRSLELTPAKFVAHFSKGDFDILIHLDADNKIDGLRFLNPVPAAPVPSTSPRPR